MKVIVDTSVWSLALRRAKAPSSPHLKKLQVLLDNGERLFLLGIILQELLQGIREPAQAKKVNDYLSYMPIIEPGKDDYVHAANIYTTCRKKGVQASTIDFLIAALAIRNECHLLTADSDFERIAKHTDLVLL